MLKLFKYKLKTNSIKSADNKNCYLTESIYYPPATREWSNSIYTFNKNTIKLLSTTDKYVLKLIKGYFNLYIVKLEKKVKLYRLRRWMRRFSIKRILISKAELKHTNDKITITIYLYNRQKIYFFNMLKKLTKVKLFFNKIKFFKEKSFNMLQKIEDNKNIFLNVLKWNNNDFKEYENKYYKIYIRKSLKKIKLYIYYKQILLLNKFKFKNTYILPLKTLIERIYNKKVEFNLISLKYYNLNPDIYLQVLAIKLKNRKNRIYTVLNKSLKKFKLPHLYEFALYTDINEKKIYNLSLNHVFFSNNLHDKLNNALLNYYELNFKLPKNYENIVLNLIKHKIFSGIRIEAAGRLSKRLVAARTIFKYKYVGNLRNLNSSYKGVSSIILRGNLRSNISYKKLGSKTKIGSYGLKSWINSI
jgi:hypothetical protein